MAAVAEAGVGFGVFWTSTGTILVLYILLVIILRMFWV
ncbi:sporulation protein YjcZ [Paenibacillus chartarius]|uniref:Sporulation protein YjcZ n=1 Tax=Paenibacillus chartarius TaxID=747481 RepID=A0ABV6DP16_9BACL